MTRVQDISHDKILLIKWRDILELHNKEGLDVKDEDDYDRVSPTVESVGKIFGVKRGMVALQPEWCPMKDHQDYEGSTGETIQLMPVGCIESIYELKIGKKLYKNPDFEDTEVKPDATGPERANP